MDSSPMQLGSIDRTLSMIASQLAKISASLEILAKVAAAEHPEALKPGVSRQPIRR